MRRPWDQAVAADIMDPVAIDVLYWALGHEHNSFTGAQFANLTRRALESLQRAADAPPPDAEPRPAVAVAVRRTPAAGASLVPSARSTLARPGAPSRVSARRKMPESRFRADGLLREARPHRPILRITSRQRARRPIARSRGGVRPRQDCASTDSS